MEFSNLVRRVKENGFINCFRRLCLFCDDRWQEWRLGISTSQKVHWRDLGLTKDCESYEAIDYNTFANVLKRITLRSGDVFLDYGCGMGRVIVLAARQPVRRVIGVEISERLCAVAEKNRDRVLDRLLCKDVQIVNSDASEFAVPKDVSVIWLFSPFFGEIMKQVMIRVHDSIAAAPRKIRIIHVVPDNITSMFRECDWLQLDSEFRVGAWQQLTCLVFTNRADSPSP